MATSRTPTLVLASVLTIAAAFGQGWVGQGRVNRPNGDTLDGAPTAAADDGGQTWVAWIGRYGDTSLLWSRWCDTCWEPQRGVGRSAPGVRCYRPDLAFSEQGRAWLVWDNAYENHNDDIAACYWDGSQWTPQQQVNRPDSTDLDFAPKVGCGGGQVWCVWYGGPTDMSPYSVYASRWNDDIGRWEPETQVSPSDSTYHWWCDVAVDSQGTPHVVWCNSDRRLICYSFYDGSGWVGPIPVNDTVLVGAPSWAAPRIAIDHTGVMHVSYTGVARGATGRDIFYTRNDGSGWARSVRVSQDTARNYNEWYSDIAADRPDNVWVVWDRQGEGTDQFRVYASHNDGRLWSTEQRLDNDSAYYDGIPVVCLDSLGCPWVLWEGMPCGTPTNGDVFFNRFLETDIAEAKPAPVPRAVRLRCAALQSGPGLDVSYDLAEAAQVRLALYDGAGRCRAVLADGHMPEGMHTVRCRRLLAPGAYLCRLQAGGQSEVNKVVLLGH
ncbi:hypothetical protein FJY71_00060 [candidate division WOR-3 bacterium]|nr:hypothetical protein [candidate division WOR-3 bacterium]